MVKKYFRHYFTAVMLFTALSSGLSLSGQVLQVTNSITPEQMVGLLIGGGVEWSNVTYSGAAIARGKFSNGPGNIGVAEGVLLTSGNINLAPGPNTQAGAGASNNGAGDPDLQQLCGVNTNDACILEFDFIPQSSMVSFNYVFASEEYPEFVGSNYNDVFGFFISGPGITGPYSNDAKNIALIPLTNTPVSINNVNQNQYSQYYVTNTQGFVQYDGFTTVLKAWSMVTPCETYHIKLAIADGGDFVYDSGVFLEANSFSAVGIDNEVTYYPTPQYDFCIEGCNNSTIQFILSEQTDFDYWMPISIEGSATNGIDYLNLPDSVFFPIGYSTADVEILPFEDNTTEWPENIKIIYNSSLCTVNWDTITVQIKDYGNLYINTTPDTTINCNTTATIGVTGIGGYGPHTIVWSTGDSTDFITVNPLISTKYYVTVIGLCDSTNTDSIMVYVNGPKANAGTDQIIPYGTPTTLQGSASQGSGQYTYSWEPAELLDDPAKPDPTTVFMENDTYFTLTVTDLSGGCQDADVVFVDVTGGPLSVNPFADPASICFGESTLLTPLASGGNEPNYVYKWTSYPEGFNSQLENPVVYPTEPTIYYVEVFDGFNYVYGEVSVNVIPLPVPDAGEDKFIPHGTATMLSGSGTGGGGSGLFYYFWEPAEFLINPTAQNPTTVKLYEPQMFRLSLQDRITGCYSEGEDFIWVNISGGPLKVVADAASYVVCDGSGTQLFAIGSGGDTTQTYAYQWYVNDIYHPFSTEQNPLINPPVTTSYIVKIDDLSNINYDTVQIAVSSLPDINLGDDKLECPYDSVLLDAGLPGLSYYWSNGATTQQIKVGTTGIGFDVKELWVQVEDSLGCVNADTIKVYFDFSYCFGVDEFEDSPRIEVYPNPTDGLMNFEIFGADGKFEIQVMNIHGQVIMRKIAEVNPGDIFKTLIDLRQVSQGVYQVRTIFKDNVFIKKVIVN